MQSMASPRHSRKLDFCEKPSVNECTSTSTTASGDKTQNRLKKKKSLSSKVAQANSTEDKNLQGYLHCSDKKELKKRTGKSLVPKSDTGEALSPEACLATKMQKSAKVHDNNLIPGVVFLSRIPHGFYETEMRQFFEQFGVVTRLKLSRNRTTGRSKHFAFIEFQSEDVAKIVAANFNGYLMYNHTLRCEFVQPDKVHPDTFANAERPFRKVPWVRIVRERQNRELTSAEWQTRLRSLKRKDAKRRQRFSDLNIDYNFAGYG